MRMHVQSLASLSGLRIWHELWCRSQMRLGSCVALAAAWGGGYSSDLTPSLGTSICAGAALKDKKDKSNNNNNSSWEDKSNNNNNSSGKYNRDKWAWGLVVTCLKAPGAGRCSRMCKEIKLSPWQL